VNASAGEHPLQQVGELLLPTGGGHAGIVVAPLASAHALAAVPAEMLQAAMAGVGAHGSASADAHPAPSIGSSGQLASILADALAGGSAGKPDIDALLHAADHTTHGRSGNMPWASSGMAAHEAYSFMHSASHVMPLTELMAVHEVAVSHAGT
jgi:hypothetical protein